MRMKAKFKTLLFIVIGIAIFAIIQFVICTIIAMYRFPDGYSFNDNFLSELGMMGHAGHQVFNGSIIAMGIMLLPMFGLLWLIDPRDSFSIRATSAFGILSAFGAIGVGTWTYDRFLVLHGLSMALWLLPMLYMVVTFFYAASRSPYVGIGFLATSLVMAIGMIVILATTDNTSIQLLQKTVVICGLVWLGFIIAYIWQSGVAILNDWIEDDGSRERKEQSYLSALTSGQHRRD
ncbi:MAG: DUF998 domain-containing protein [Planctomycetota bacterium]